MEHTYRRVMTLLTPPNSVCKYVPDVNDTMSLILKALTSLRTYQGVITHFLWDMKIIKICLRHPAIDVTEYPFTDDKRREKHKVNNYCNSDSCLPATYWNWHVQNQFLVSSLHWLFDEKMSVKASKYFQYKPTGGCSGTIEPKRLADTPQSCVHG